jgi:hypothetical protein
MLLRVIDWAVIAAAVLSSGMKRIKFLLFPESR